LGTDVHFPADMTQQEAHAGTLPSRGWSVSSLEAPVMDAAGGRAVSPALHDLPPRTVLLQKAGWVRKE
jgi:hypothetical protein